MEALGLAIFMISACFFAGLFEAETSYLHKAISPETRHALNALLMGATALLIFYSPFTSPSGAHINPAVTITFLRLAKISRNDAFFYIVFQFLGGTMAVYAMAFLMRDHLTLPPVNYAVTVPGKQGQLVALATEFSIAFIMITMVLFTSANDRFKKYTKTIAACLVSTYVLVAGPISGFGMNPARTFASAVPAHIFTSFWIYLTAPVLGMLTAAEFYLFYCRTRTNGKMKLAGMHMYRPQTFQNNL